MGFWNRSTVLLAILLAGELFAAQSTSDHVVSTSELHRAVYNSDQARLDNLARLDKLVSSGPARKLFEGIDPTKVSCALAMLSDEEARKSGATERDNRERPGCWWAKYPAAAGHFAGADSGGTGWSQGGLT